MGIEPFEMSPMHQAPGNSRIAPKTERLSKSSRWLHKVDHYTSQPWAALLFGTVLVSTVLLGAILGFPAPWTTAFEVGASFITLMMLVVIQHTKGANRLQLRENSTSYYGPFPRRKARS